MSEVAQTPAPTLVAMLPPTLAAEQRVRYAADAAIVTATTDGVPHATDEFFEPAPIFALHIPGIRAPGG